MSDASTKTALPAPSAKKQRFAPETEVNLITGALILAAISITASVYLGVRVILGSL